MPSMGPEMNNCFAMFNRGTMAKRDANNLSRSRLAGLNNQLTA
jgi:hypothetical protein